MKNHFRLVTALVVFVVVSFLYSFAQGASGSPAIKAVPANEDKPTTALPYTPSLDVPSMDKSANPCVDFYQYTCGGWMKNNPIPGDQASWSVYGKLAQDNQRFLWGVLDDLAHKTTGRTPTQQKIGDYFAACMDEPAIESLGAAPLKPQLDEIAAAKTRRDLSALLARLHLSSATGGLFFNFGSAQDYADATQVIASADAGGLGLPDRDYYTKTDAESVGIRKKYLIHIQNMLKLLGDSPEVAKNEADVIMKIETGLAKASLTRVQQRNPHNLFHKMDRNALKSLAPNFDWDTYLKTAGIAGVNTLNVTQPEFYKELNRQLNDNSLDDLRVYLRWHIVSANAPYLSSQFVQENFDFYSHTLRGVEQQPPRWKRCVRLVDRELGEALGQEFVARTFTADTKKSAVTMTREIEQAMESDIQQLAWMGPETKKQAL